MGDDLVLPADDNDFAKFKEMCESTENWQECYNKKNVNVTTRNQANSSIKLLRVSESFFTCSTTKRCQLLSTGTGTSSF